MVCWNDKRFSHVQVLPPLGQMHLTRQVQTVTGFLKFCSGIWYLLSPPGRKEFSQRGFLCHVYRPLDAPPLPPVCSRASGVPHCYTVQWARICPPFNSHKDPLVLDTLTVWFSANPKLVMQVMHLSWILLASSQKRHTLSKMFQENLDYNVHQWLPKPQSPHHFSPIVVGGILD